MKKNDKKNELLKILKTAFPYFKKEEVYTLDNFYKALECLGNPHKKIEKKVVHVAGTNGKGF